MNPLRAYRRLPATDRAIVRRTFALIPITGLGIRSFGMRRTQGLLRSLLSAMPPVGAPGPRIAQLVDRTADQLRPRPLCLARSLVLEALLQRVGEPAVLRIGARRTPAFEAHAWVELDGVALNDSAHAFTPLLSRNAALPSD